MMNNGVAARLARLRGSLPQEEPGARGLERIARNPCARLRALTMVGLTPATAASEIYGEPAREGQSPFALAAGNRFERQLFDSGAARLLGLYRSRGRLRVEESRVVVVPDLAPGVNAASMMRRRTETARLFRMKLDGNPASPNIIVKPRIVVALLGIPHPIEPDLLVASDDEPFYRPVEVKSYADRGGKTDPADTRGACRQAAVAVVGLRQVLVEAGVRDPKRLVPEVADLVFAIPGSFRPTLREMELRGEVDSLERALSQAPRNLDELEELVAGIGLAATLDSAEVLDQIPNNYLESCREHCALAQRCKREALAAGAPVVLGSVAREELAAAGSIDRSLNLLRDRGAPPRTPAERALKEQLQAAYQEYRRAAGQ